MTEPVRSDTPHQRRLTIPAPAGHTLTAGTALIHPTHVTVTLDVVTAPAEPRRAATRRGDLTVRVTGPTRPGGRPRHAIYHPRRPTPDLSSHPHGPIPEWVTDLIAAHVRTLEAPETTR